MCADHRRLVAVDPDGGGHRGQRAQVGADPTAQVDGRARDPGEAAGPVRGDDTRRRLLETVPGQQQPGCLGQLPGSPLTQLGLLTRGGDEVGRPAAAQPLGNGKVGRVCGGEEVVGREQRPRLRRRQRRMPASG
jgi:hypothetical protein